MYETDSRIDTLIMRVASMKSELATSLFSSRSCSVADVEKTARVGLSDATFETHESAFLDISTGTSFGVQIHQLRPKRWSAFINTSPLSPAALLIQTKNFCVLDQVARLLSSQLCLKRPLGSCGNPSTRSVFQGGNHSQPALSSAATHDYHPSCDDIGFPDDISGHPVNPARVLCSLRMALPKYRIVNCIE